MGKGSKQRPCDKDRFNESFDKIEWKPRKEIPEHGKTQKHRDRKKDAKRDNYVE